MASAGNSVKLSSRCQIPRSFRTSYEPRYERSHRFLDANRRSVRPLHFAVFKLSSELILSILSCITSDPQPTGHYARFLREGEGRKKLVVRVIELSPPPPTGYHLSSVKAEQFEV